MHAQTISTTARSAEATPTGARTIMSAALGAPPRRPALSRIYPSDLKTRAEALAAVDTGNDRWPELLEKLSEVSDTAVEAVRLQKEGGWDLDLAADSVLACYAAIDAGIDLNYDPVREVIERHQSRIVTRNQLGVAARKWIEIFRAEGGRFVEDREVGTFGTLWPSRAMTRAQRRYFAKLEKLAFPFYEDPDASPTALACSIRAQVETKHQDLIAPRPTGNPEAAPAPELFRPAILNPVLAAAIDAYWSNHQAYQAALAAERAPVASEEKERLELETQDLLDASAQCVRNVVNVRVTDPADMIRKYEIIQHDLYNRTSEAAARDTTGFVTDEHSYDAEVLMDGIMADIYALASTTAASPMLDALAERNRLVHPNRDDDLSDEEFDRRHDASLVLNNQILDDASLTPDSALAKLRLILRADVVEDIQFNEATIHGAIRSTIAVLEGEHPSLRRNDAGLEQFDRASAWIEEFLSSGGSIARHHRDDVQDHISYHRMTYDIPVELRDRSNALLRELDELPDAFAGEVKRIALNRMAAKSTDVLPSPQLSEPVAIAAE